MCGLIINIISAYIPPKMAPLVGKIQLQKCFQSIKTNSDNMASSSAVGNQQRERKNRGGVSDMMLDAGKGLARSKRSMVDELKWMIRFHHVTGHIMELPAEVAVEVRKFS